MVKKITLIANFILMLLVVSCEEETGEDYIIAQNNSVFEQYYSDTIAVLVKTRYYAINYYDSEVDEDTLYSANTLFMKNYDSDNWLFLEKLDADSGMNVVKWDNINKKIFFRYSDSLLYEKDLRDPELSTTTIFDPDLFPEIADHIFTLAADSAYIDSINNSQWYLSYEDWANGIMDYYW